MKKVSSKDTTLGIALGLLSGVFVAGYVTTNKYIYSHHDISAVEYGLIFSITGALYAALSLGFQANKRLIGSVAENKLSLFALGIAGALAVGIFTIGQRYTTAVNASLLMTSTIVATALFSHYLLGEKHEKEKYGWIVALFVGLYIGIVGPHRIQLQSGDLIVLSSVLFFGFGNAYSRVVMKRMGGARLVPDVRLAIGGSLALILAPFVIDDAELIKAALPAALLAGLFYWLCMKCFAKAVYLINANNTIVLNNAQIFFTSLAGVMILSEAYSWEKLVGSLIAITAIYNIAAKK